MSHSGFGSIQLAVVLWFALVGCDRGQAVRQVAIDGSSTVFPILEAVAESFREEAPQVRVTIGFSGTGGGMQRFVHGELDICNASRAISASEREIADQNGIGYLELQIAYDGLAVVAHPENDWCDCLTVAQLKEIWRPESTVVTWSDLNPDWPAKEIRLYGPGTDSGTFDFFTAAIVGEERACRADYTASEDDNILASGVQVDRYALGYFGFAYYQENKDRLKLMGVDGGSGCVTPSQQTVRDGTYIPLSRPLYIYVRRAALARAEVLQFIQFSLDHVAALATEVGYIAAPNDAMRENRRLLNEVIDASRGGAR